MKIEIELKKIFYFVVIIFLASSMIYLYIRFRPVKIIYYYGAKFEFRDNIRAAQKIKVYPDEKTLHDIFWDPNVENITILFKPVDKYMGYYSIENFELSYKLSLMYMLNERMKNFNAMPIDSYDEIRDSPINLQIALVHPSLTNKTSVETIGHMVYIYGKDARDFDLATIKTILVAMNVTV